MPEDDDYERFIASLPPEQQGEARRLLDVTLIGYSRRANRWLREQQMLLGRWGLYHRRLLLVSALIYLSVLIAALVVWR